MKSQLIDSPTPMIAAACAFDEPISNTPPSELLNSPNTPGGSNSPIIVTPTSTALQPIAPVPNYHVNPSLNSATSTYPLNPYTQQPSHNPYQSYMYPQTNSTPGFINATPHLHTYNQPQIHPHNYTHSPYPYSNQVQPRQSQPVRYSLQYPFIPEPSSNYMPTSNPTSVAISTPNTMVPVKKEPTSNNNMEIVSFTPSKESDERAITTQQHHNNGHVEVPQYQDITHILCWNQIEAAKSLNIPTSTLSKRWKEAVRNRKWPYCSVCKVDKEMLSLLQSIPKDAKHLPPEIQVELARLIKIRNDLLKPVIIRTNGV